MASDLPRCTEPGCPYRWRTGRDRPCLEHAGRTGHPAEKYAELLVAPGDQSQAVTTPQ